ncbi:TPA: hypothetical protein N0F65_007585 [Lagenidium giganteum]|uniref:Amino acid permease/ SLC12A domain-containing protein n=1 Tax=Lagenidium giganteum TaxID=4803 RepID=A0AAV2ZEW6_9STRA|nr:TPA: hypothetical protein N0F65_007585 [Lagenidium giganteum]
MQDMPIDVDVSSTPIASSYKVLRKDIWMLGITIGLGGQYYSWNSGLVAGLYSYMIDFFLVGFAYIALCCCMSEITGALPFAGGAYGLSRCTLGFYPGFLIGCCEALEYIAYVATAVLSLTDMIVEAVPALKNYDPLICVLIYGSALFFHIRGGAIFWRWNFFIGCSSLMIVVIYCFGALPHVNFAVNADDPDYRFVDGISGFLRVLPLTCWFFVGVEALNLASDDVENPSEIIPFAQISCILTIFGLAVVVFFVTVALPPPGLTQVSKLLAPFDNGFELIFQIHHSTATLWSIPAMYATTFGFMWGYGKLIAAMATSQLLPPSLATMSRYGTPHVALISGACLSYLMGLCVYLNPSVQDSLYNVCITAAFMAYAGQCIGYISLKKLYPNIQSSTFHSPFGIYGAVFSLTIWIIGLISIIFFQERRGLEFGAFMTLVTAVSIFYYVYAKDRQSFSPQENKVFLVAHIMKFNYSRKQAEKHQATMMAIRNIAMPLSNGQHKRWFWQRRGSDSRVRNQNQRPVLKPPIDVMSLRYESMASSNHTPREAAPTVVVPKVAFSPRAPHDHSRPMSPFQQYFSQRALIEGEQFDDVHHPSTEDQQQQQQQQHQHHEQEQQQEQQDTEPDAQEATREHAWPHLEKEAQGDAPPSVISDTSSTIQPMT